SIETTRTSIISLHDALPILDNFGFTTLAHGTEADTDADGNVWTDANLSMALGGLTHGVTNVELCAAYAAIANGGNYIEPIYYTRSEEHTSELQSRFDLVCRL